MRTFFFLSLVLLVAHVTAQPSKQALDSLFKGYTAAFILCDAKNDTTFRYNQPETAVRRPPCSTFKIFNSLVALETGVLKDENDSTIRWDKKVRQIKEWNREHTLRSAIAHSVVWYYQEIARRVGEEKMKFWLTKVGYGNMDMSGGLTTFWLESSITISAQEQIEFLKRLHAGTLPFSKRSMDIVKKIMLTESEGGYKLYGKTGSGIRHEEKMGWYVGWIESGGKTWFFALNIRNKGNASGWKAKELVKGALKLFKLM